MGRYLKSHLPRGGHLPGQMGRSYLYRSAGIDAPTDGPDAVYVPTTTEHYTALGATPPDECWAMQDADTELTPSIGARVFQELTSAGLTYQHSVAGWSRYFARIQGGGRWWREDGLSLASGESLVVFGYMYVTNPDSRQPLIRPARTLTEIRHSVDGTIRPSVIGEAADGGEDHSGVDDVFAFMLVRNAGDSEAALYTTKEKIAVTYDGGADSGDFMLGAGGGGSSDWNDGAIGLLALWQGDSADDFIADGFANETWFETCGWTLGAGYP